MDGERERAFFPIELPASVHAHLCDSDTARQAIDGFGNRIFPSRESFGAFVTPKARRQQRAPLEEQYTRSCPMWVIFGVQGEPVGWFYGYMEDSETFFIDTVGLVPAYRRRGIYSAFLPHLIAYLRALGYERLTTSHHPDNRAVMIPELEAGFSIAGLELHEGCGPLIKMVYLFHDDRRESFRRVFSIPPDTSPQRRRHESDRGQMRRKEQEIRDPALLQAILEQATICRIAMVDDGEPYIVPMNYGYAGGCLYMHTAQEGRKIDLLRRNPRVCFEVELGVEVVPNERACGWATQYTSVIGYGTVAFVPPEAVRDALDVLMQRHSGRGGWSYQDKALDRVLVLRLEIESMTGKRSHS
jgi:nitroimidazol reductase NimA-like FMN-containing flavoprotein (pyridoxamine 5'-phosphate oxidase superfamily)/GNAT superfamily N-acetyltransferase